jgi:PAS domain-containing protein
MQDVLRKLAEQTAITWELLRQYASLEAKAKSRSNIIDKFVLLSETDTRGVITYANPRFCEVSGYTLEELIGKPHNIMAKSGRAKSKTAAKMALIIGCLLPSAPSLTKTEKSLRMSLCE